MLWASLIIIRGSKGVMAIGVLRDYFIRDNPLIRKLFIFLTTCLFFPFQNCFKPNKSQPPGANTVNRFERDEWSGNLFFITTAVLMKNIIWFLITAEIKIHKFVICSLGNKEFTFHANAQQGKVRACDPVILLVSKLKNDLGKRPQRAYKGLFCSHHLASACSSLCGQL